MRFPSTKQLTARHDPVSRTGGVGIFSPPMSISSPELVGQTPSGQPVHAYTLTGKGGLSVRFLTFGGIVTHLFAPDRQGKNADVVLGFGDLASYLKPHPFFGTITGRVAGRISDCRFTLAGVTYPLANSEPGTTNHLHGGMVGFDKHVWAAAPVARTDGAPSVRLSRLSPDGEEGYPGNLSVAITYTVTARNEFVIDTEATTDKATPVSVTHHSYFNLAGEASGQSVEDHTLQIFADDYALTDKAFAFTGKRVPVTPGGNDFRTPRLLRDALPHLLNNHGDNYFIGHDFAAPRSLAPVARLHHPASGRVLTVRSTEDCLQMYSGSGLDPSVVGKANAAYRKHAGICLECQGFPDSLNHPGVGLDITLHPGQTQRQTTIYAFTAE